MLHRLKVLDAVVVADTVEVVDVLHASLTSGRHRCLLHNVAVFKRPIRSLYPTRVPIATLTIYIALCLLRPSLPQLHGILQIFLSVLRVKSAHLGFEVVYASQH